MLVKPLLVLLKLEFPVEMCSICECEVHPVEDGGPWKWEHELEPQPALQFHSSPIGFSS
jgi:hypothetical protein